MTIGRKIQRSLAITTHIGCANQCVYCPQKTIAKAYNAVSTHKSMSFEDFKTYMSSVPKHIPLSFAGFSEPWLNPATTEMVLYAHEQGYPVRVNTTLVGVATTDIKALEKVPFIRFAVHLPDNTGKTRITVNDAYLAVLEFLLKSKISQQFYKYHKTQLMGLNADVKSLLRKYNQKAKAFSLNNRAGYASTENKYRTPNKTEILKKCSDFKHNILLPNGDVVLCHMDWGMKHVLGNLRNKTFEDIFESEEFKKIHQALTDPKTELLCRQCEKDITYKSFIAGFAQKIMAFLKGENIY